MRSILTFFLVFTLVGTVAAIDLGSSAPAKAPTHGPVNVPVRQGGDTIMDAVSIDLPYSGTGTTSGFSDDYDEVCPYSDSTAPDVVYTFTPQADVALVVDMLGSAYDTKIYIYDGDLNLVDCNDDFYPDYTSKLEDVLVVAGLTYYLVIDGYGDSFGDYTLEITEFEPCIIECPAGGYLEGEPTLVDGYIDEYNGGCNTEGSTPFQHLPHGLFCGKTGYYNSIGAGSRDTDWFEVVIANTPCAVLEITGDAEEATYMFELAPQDCGSVAVVQSVEIGPCEQATMTIVGDLGSVVWFWVGPTTYWDGETYEYNYVLNVGGSGCTAVEDYSLTRVKSLFK